MRWYCAERRENYYWRLSKSYIKCAVRRIHGTFSIDRMCFITPKNRWYYVVPYIFQMFHQNWILLIKIKFVGNVSTPSPGPRNSWNIFNGKIVLHIVRFKLLSVWNQWIILIKSFEFIHERSFTLETAKAWNINLINKMKYVNWIPLLTMQKVFIIDLNQISLFRAIEEKFDIIMRLL